MELVQRRLIWCEQRAQLACKQCCQRCGTWTGWTRLHCRWMGYTGALLGSNVCVHCKLKQHGLSDRFLLLEFDVRRHLMQCQERGAPCLGPD